jgi:multidrug efflux pump subunit AcrB
VDARRRGPRHRLLMLIDIMVTNAIMLLDLMQHKIEAGAGVRTALIQAGRTHMRPILMTAAATILALVPPLLGASGIRAKRGCLVHTRIIALS